MPSATYATYVGFMHEVIDNTSNSDLQNVGVNRSEICLHLLFLGMATIVLLMSFLMRYEEGTRVFLPGIQSAIPSICSSRLLFGINCPGCGLTRAFIAISHGQFQAAWNFNPASFAVYAFVAVQIPWHLMQLWRFSRHRPPIEHAVVYLAPIGLVIVLFVNWLLRLQNMVV